MAIAGIVLLAAVVSTWQAVRATRAEQEQSRLRAVVQEALREEAQQRQRAETEEWTALRRVYNSDMTLAQQALGANNYGRVVGLLDRYRPKPGETDFRQWEWRYFWNQSRSEAAFALPRQPNAVNAVAISPDGRMSASIDMRRELRLWDLTTRTELAVLREPGSDGRTFVFSHDGVLGAVAGSDGPRPSTIHIWRMADRKVTAEFPCDGRIQKMAFSQDDTKLLILGEDMTVRTWDLAQQYLHSTSPAVRPPHGSRTLVAFSSDRESIAFLDGRRVCVRNLTTGAEIAVADGFEGGTTSLAFSPDGQRLASGSQGNEAVKLWDVPTRQEVVTLAGEELMSGGLRFSPDCRLLAGINSWGKVHIWRAPSLHEIAALEQQAATLLR